MKKLTLIFFSLLCFIAAPAYAKAEENYISDYYSTLYTTDNGLSSNEVTSIAQTSNGYIWAGAVLTEIILLIYLSITRLHP